MFRIEAVFAKHGDALLLEYSAPGGEVKRLLIDGGARGVWRGWLKPRLDQIRGGAPLPLQLVMVSHVDQDHIAGVLDLFKDLKNPGPDGPTCDPFQLWHNSFDDIIGNEDEELVNALLSPVPAGDAAASDPDGAAVVASVGEGRTLRKDAEALAMAVNEEFDGKLILATGSTPPELDMDAGLVFQVIGPSVARVRAYQEEWNEYLEEKDLAKARATAFNDRSAFNLASIIVLATKDDRTMLLTGDARGDHIVNGLVDGGFLAEAARFPEREDFESTRAWRRAVDEADALAVDTPFHVDLLKAPHHGSANNVTVGFFRRLTADHYVFSGNGHHHNPDPDTLRMLAEARGDAPYTIHFTFTADQHETEPNAKFAANLRTVHDWVENEKPASCTVIHRASASVPSIAVELA